MGGICSCADREPKDPNFHALVLREKTIEFEDNYGLGLQGKTLIEISDQLVNFKPTTLRLFDGDNSKHTPLSIIMVDRSGYKFEEVLVKFKYNNGILKIAVSSLPENYPITEKANIDNLYIYGEFEVKYK